MRTDGESFAPLLDGGTSSRDAFLTQMLFNSGGIPRWWSVRTTDKSPLAGEGCAAAATRECVWHYIEYATTGERELYDLSGGACWQWRAGRPGDPCELENRAGDPALADIQAELARRLAQLKAE